MEIFVACLFLPFMKRSVFQRGDNTLLFMKGRNRQATKISITIPVYCTVEHGCWGGWENVYKQGKQELGILCSIKFNHSPSVVDSILDFVHSLTPRKDSPASTHPSLTLSSLMNQHSHESTLTLYRKLRLVSVRNPELNNIVM